MWKAAEKPECSADGKIGMKTDEDNENRRKTDRGESEKTCNGWRGFCQAERIGISSRSTEVQKWKKGDIFLELACYF